MQDVPTRKVAAISEQLIGSAMSPTQVSRASGLLDEGFQAWRVRVDFRYPYLDARYEHVRQSLTRAKRM